MTVSSGDTKKKRQTGSKSIPDDAKSGKKLNDNNTKSDRSKTKHDSRGVGGSSSFRTIFVCIAVLTGVAIYMYQNENIHPSAHVPSDSTSRHLDDENSSLSFRIAAYLPDYRFYINLNHTTPFLTDLILFSIAPSPPVFGGEDNMLSGCCLSPDKFHVAHEAREYKTKMQPLSWNKDSDSSLKIWVSIGGAGRSEYYLKDPKSLTNAILKLAAKYNLDGIDLDNEYFTSRQDYDQYMNWINVAAPILKKRGGLLVSVALHAGQFLLPDLYNKVDRINLMTYDMQGPSYHAAFDAVKIAVQRLIQSGCPASKIVLGIPAYARHEHNPGDVKSYSELVDEQEKEEESQHGIMERNKLDSFDSWNGYKAESPRSVREKVQYAQMEGLAGVFLWELGQDKQHPHAQGGILLESAAGKIFDSSTIGGGAAENPSPHAEL